MSGLADFWNINFGLVVFVSSMTAACLGLVLIPLVRKTALKYGFVDSPGGRKQHNEPVPPIGGMVIFSVFLAVMLVSGGIFRIVLPSSLLIALAIILVMGVIDDRRGVNAGLKFAVHFLVAGILVIGGGAELKTLGNLLGFGELTLGWMSIPFSIACVVYIINAVNMMDGLDGLAAGNALIIFAWFGLSALWMGDHKILLEIAVFCSCLLAFLYYNARSPWRNHASVFLGDAGSMGIGVMIAYYAISLTQGHNHEIEPVSVAWIIALPIIDAFGLLVARLKDKKPPFSPDRRHFHHHFIHAGFGVGASVALILGYSALLGAIGFLGEKSGIPDPLLGWAWVALWISHAILTMKHEKFITLLSRFSKTPDFSKH